VLRTEASHREVRTKPRSFRYVVNLSRRLMPQPLADHAAVLRDLLHVSLSGAQRRLISARLVLSCVLRISARTFIESYLTRARLASFLAATMFVR